MQRPRGNGLPSRVWIADRPEHAAEDALVEFHTILPQELSEGTLGVEEVVSLRHETLGFVLSVRTLAGLSGQHQLRTCFSGEGERPRFQRHLETQPCLRCHSEARPSVRRGPPRTKGEERTTCTSVTFSASSFGNK